MTEAIEARVEAEGEVRCDEPHPDEELRLQRLQQRYDKQRQLRALEVRREEAFLRMCAEQREEAREENRRLWVEFHHRQAANVVATAQRIADDHLRMAQQLERRGM